MPRLSPPDELDTEASIRLPTSSTSQEVELNSPSRWNANEVEPSAEDMKLANKASAVSWAANIVLLMIKVVAYWVSKSESVAAASVD